MNLPNDKADVCDIRIIKIRQLCFKFLRTELSFHDLNIFFLLGVLKLSGVGEEGEKTGIFPVWRMRTPILLLVHDLTNLSLVTMAKSS